MHLRLICTTVEEAVAMLDGLQVRMGAVRLGSEREKNRIRTCWGPIEQKYMNHVLVTVQADRCAGGWYQ